MPTTCTTSCTDFAFQSWCEIGIYLKIVFAMANGKKTPSKIHVHGLLTLSSSHKKKNLSKCFQKANKNVSIPIDLNYGLVKRESFIKFTVNIFQYLLYDSEVIPIPFQYFDRIYSLESPNTEIQFKKNKSVLSKMFTNLNAVFTFLSKLFEESSIEPSCIAMCFGDSIRFAKEIYSLNLSSLNLYPKSSGELNLPTTPLLTLNYLIKTFYQKLLNAAAEEDVPKGNSAAKSKATNVFFTIKISSQDIDTLESFANSKASNKDASAPCIAANHFQYLYRLGCTVTKTTSFVLSHQPNRNMAFAIYNDNYGVEEIIEENLIEEEEEILTKNTLVTLNDSSELVSSNSSDLANHEGESGDLISDKKNFSEFIWVQIGAPIRCFSKL